MYLIYARKQRCCKPKTEKKAGAHKKAPIFYKSGASGDWKKDTAGNFTAKSFSGGSSRLAWNEDTGSTWQQTEVGQLNLVLVHIFATNDINTPIIAVQGQAEYSNVGNARAGANDEISNLVTTGLPFQEFAPIGSIIFQTSTTYSNTPQARIRSTDEGENYVDFRGSALSPSTAPTNHGNLTGLGDDDHPQYLQKTLSAEDHTANDTLTAAESGSVHTNKGAGGAIELTLPTAAAGLTFTFVVAAAQFLRVNAASGDTARYLSDVSASAGYFRSNNIGDQLTVTAINDTEWIVTSLDGTFTVDE